MEDSWARYIEPSDQPGPDYWNYFAQRLVDLATTPEGAAVSDVGTYDGRVLLKAMKRTGTRGLGVRIDICRGGLKDGTSKAIEYGLGNMAFAQMDAACLAFLSGTYDTVLANFVGWDDCFDFNRMEFIAPDSRMAQIIRVLKPGREVGVGFWIEQCDLGWIAEAFKRYPPGREEATGSRTVTYGKDNSEGNDDFCEETIKLHNSK